MPSRSAFSICEPPTTAGVVETVGRTGQDVGFVVCHFCSLSCLPESSTVANILPVYIGHSLDDLSLSLFLLLTIPTVGFADGAVVVTGHCNGPTFPMICPHHLDGFHLSLRYVREQTPRQSVPPSWELSYSAGLSEDCLCQTVLVPVKTVWSTCVYIYSTYSYTHHQNQSKERTTTPCSAHTQAGTRPLYTSSCL